MPYPLPPAYPYSTGVRWFLVCVPEDVEFRQAALDAYTNLALKRFWGKDGEASEAQRESAANLWQIAIAQTLEAWQMGFPDTLLGYIDGVEALLQQLVLKEVCCGTEMPGGGLPNTDYNYDDEDPVPANVISAGYATGVSDYTGMAAYKCMISHLYVRNVAAKLNEYAKYFDNAGDVTLSVAGVAAIAAALFVGAAITGFIALPLIGIEMLLGIGAAAGIFGAIGELGETALQDAADELVTNEDNYACAIYGEDGPAAGYTAFSDYVSASISAEVAAIIDLIGGLQDLAALYTGRYADSDVAAELAAAGYDPADYDCECAWIPMEGDYRAEIEVYGSTDYVYAYSASSAVTVVFPDVATYRYLDGSYYKFGGLVKLYKYLSGTWTRVQFQWTAHSLSPIPNNETSSYGVRAKQSDGAGDYFQYDGTTPALPTNVQGGLSLISLLDASTTQGNVGFTGGVTVTSLT